MITVDLRSDTVTKPTQEMREAIARAEVGDDVLGEDPTVKRLEETAAEMVGKEAALFVASGTMGNQVAVLNHTSRGDEVIVDAQAHIFYYEVGASSMLSAVQLRPIAGLHGRNALSLAESAIRDDNIHYPRTSLLCLENTHNRRSGTVMRPEAMRELYLMAKDRGISVHVDGARIFNAAIALGCNPRSFTEWCDSIMFCLSKGLGAPVGSMLAGNKDFIDRARKYRKALGGGMRQAGILAAAGLVALRSVDRLAEDHVHARMLAKALAEVKGINVDLGRVQTNIVVADVSEAGMSAEDYVAVLKHRGVLASSFGPTLVRFVTHRDISRQNIEYAKHIILNSL